MSEPTDLSNLVIGSGLALGVAFGAVANRTNFCTMGAISDIVNMSHWGRMRMWLLAIAVAIVGTTALGASGLVDLSKAVTQRPVLDRATREVGPQGQHDCEPGVQGSRHQPIGEACRGDGIGFLVRVELLPLVDHEQESPDAWALGKDPLDDVLQFDLAPVGLCGLEVFGKFADPFEPLQLLARARFALEQFEQAVGQAAPGFRAGT